MKRARDMYVNILAVRQTDITARRCVCAVLRPIYVKKKDVWCILFVFRISSRNGFIS